MDPLLLLVSFSFLSVSAGARAESPAEQLGRKMAPCSTHCNGLSSSESSQESFDTNNTKSKRETKEVSRPDSNQVQLKSSSPETSLTSRAKDFQIDVRATVTSVQASSVVINLRSDVMFRPTVAKKFVDNVGLKLIFRSFGSVVEREILINVRNVSGASSEGESELASLKFFNSSSDDYLIDNLHSETGYVICFSLVMGQNSIAEVEEQQENRPILDVEYHHSSLKEDLSRVSVQESQHKLDNSNHGVVKPIMTTTMKPEIKPYTATTTRPIPQSDAPVRRRNYAYTNTGQLIHLPSSSWNPYQPRSKRGAKELKTKYCLEVKTLPQSEMSSIFVLIVSMCFLLMCIVVLAIFVIFKSSCKKIKWSKFIKCKNSKGKEVNNTICDINKEIINTDNAKTYKKSYDTEENQKNENCFYNEEYSEISECTEGEISAPKLLPKKCSQVLSKKEFDGDVNHLRKPRPLCLHLKPGISSDEFHPGYEVPPASTVEVYGYDFPKHCNKESGTPVSMAPSSCELNDFASDISWDNISSRFNLDLPHMRNKRSEGNKYIYEPNPSCVKKYNTFHQRTSPFYHSNEDAPLSQQDLSTKSKPPSYEIFQKMETNKNLGYNISPCSTLPLNQEVPQAFQGSHDGVKTLKYDSASRDDTCATKVRSTPSLGDITISGGTLIEVPEGYVIPRAVPKPVAPSSPSVVRIKVTGD